MSLSSVAKASICVVLGLSLALIGLLSYILFPRILKWQVEESLVLSPEAEPYDYWKKIPVPIYCRFYFFNITNSLDIQQYNAKPILQELGPYTFRETREKFNITWNDNGTVSYKQVKRWFFEPEDTKGSLDDLITTLNVPVVSTAFQAKMFGDPDFYFTVEELMVQMNSEIFITQPVRNLLFEGYPESWLDLAKDIGFDVPYDKFGWFYMKNNSDDGLYTIFTGKNGVEKYGHVDKWNGKSHLTHWYPPCDAISGTAGDMWPPFRNSKYEKLTLFVSDICSSLRLSFLSDVEINDIESYRYWLDATTFDNGREDKHNKCYCNETCIPSGVLDISKCQHDSPAAVSFPHFLYADPIYRQKFIGLKPDPLSHHFIIDLEPKLGIPINVDAKLQINVAIPKVEDIRQFNFINETIYYPIFWFSEAASINIETAQKLKFVTKSLPQYVTIGAFLLVIIGGIILTLTLFHTIRYVRNKPNHKIVYTAVRIKT